MKLPRDLSGTEVAKLLERHYGYRVDRTRELSTLYTGIVPS